MNGNEEYRRPEAEDLSALLDRCGRGFAHRAGGIHRGQGRVLALLAQSAGRPQRELADALGVIPASLSETLAKLEHKGLIERSRDEGDRRVQLVWLTPKGEQVLAQAEQPSGDDPFLALSEEEKEDLHRLLSKLLADWDSRPLPERDGRLGGAYARRGVQRRGRGREHPGHDSEHPGHGNEHPGHGNEHPGHGNEHPGHGNEHPGHDSEHPGHGNEHPGHGNEHPGHGGGRNARRPGGPRGEGAAETPQEANLEE